MNIWQELEIAPTNDLRAIKSAYAKRLKQVNPEVDADGFQRLRQAYEQAQALAPHIRIENRVPAGTEAGAETRPATVPLPAAEQPAADQLASELQQDPNLQRDSGQQAEQAQTESAPEREAVVSRPNESKPSRDPAPPHNGPSPSTLSLPAPQVAAAQICQMLLGSAELQRPGRLHAVVRQPGLENLDYQAALEVAFVNYLNQNFDQMFPVVASIAEFYGWQANRLQTRPLEQAISLLMARTAARRWRLNAEADSPQHKQIMALLMAPVDVKANRKFARWSRNVNLMRTMLAELFARNSAVIRFELNGESVNWWRDFVNSFPLTLDRLGRSLMMGIFIGPIIVAVISGYIQDSTGVDLWKYPYPMWALCVLSVGIPLLVLWISRVLRRPKAAERIARVERWRAHQLQSPRKYLWYAAAVISLLGTLWTGTLPGFGIFPVVATLLLWMMTSFRATLVSVGLTAWVLQIPISLQLARLLELVPQSIRWFKDPPIILFPHMVAAFLVEPMINVLLPQYQKLYPQQTINRVYFGLVISVVAAVICGVYALLHYSPSTDPTMPAQSQTHRVNNVNNKNGPGPSPAVPEVRSPLRPLLS